MDYAFIYDRSKNMDIMQHGEAPMCLDLLRLPALENSREMAGRQSLASNYVYDRYKERIAIGFGLLFIYRETHHALSFGAEILFHHCLCRPLKNDEDKFATWHM